MSALAPGQATVRLAARIFPSLNGNGVLLIGSGRMIEDCEREFAARGARITRFRGDAAALPLELPRHDVVVSFSVQPLLHRDLVKAALRARRRRPILVIDLGLPGGVDPAVAELEDAFVYNLDDLTALLPP